MCGPPGESYGIDQLPPQDQGSVDLNGGKLARRVALGLKERLDEAPGEYTGG